MAETEIEGLRLGVVHETGDKQGREKRCEPRGREQADRVGAAQARDERRR